MKDSHMKKSKDGNNRYWLVSDEDEGDFIVGLIFDPSGEHHTNHYKIDGTFVASIEHVYDFDGYVRDVNKAGGWIEIDLQEYIATIKAKKKAKKMPQKPQKMPYIILLHSDVGKLEDEVAELLQEGGWKLIGGPFITPSSVMWKLSVSVDNNDIDVDDPICWCQAMARTEYL